MPGPDLADLISYAQARDGKVILAGDTGQLQAVENGGGLSLLAGALGYVQLAEPARFRAGWEQAASLRLRDGDTSVLAEYDQHARITGGEPEQMMDAAAADYVALTLDGTDVLLMAADHALRQELSRRIRDDLIRLDIVSAGARSASPTARWPARGPDRLYPQRPHGPGRGARPHAGQRRPAPHRYGHPGRPGRPPRPGRRPGDRAAAVDRTELLVLKLRRCRIRVCGHRSCGPGPDRVTGLTQDLLYDQMRRGNLAYVKVRRRRRVTHNLQQFLGDTPCRQLRPLCGPAERSEF